MLVNNALTTLDRMKLMLGLPDTLDGRTELMLSMLINKVSFWIEHQTGRHLGKKRYVQKYFADGQQELVLEEYPILAIEYIKENELLISPELYDFKQSGNIGVVFRDTGWLYAGYRKGLAYDLISTSRSIEVCYTAGYILPKDATDEHPSTLPVDLEGLVWEIVAQAYTGLQNGSQGLSSFSISDVHWVFDKTMHPEWVRIINMYRRY